MAVSFNVVDECCGQTYKGAKVVPDFRYIRIQADGSRICIKCIAILVDLIIEHSNRAPERRIPPISVDCLLVCFICFWELLLGHITTPQQIPALSVLIVCKKVLDA